MAKKTTILLDKKHIAHYLTPEEAQDKVSKGELFYSSKANYEYRDLITDKTLVVSGIEASKLDNDDRFILEGTPLASQIRKEIDEDKSKGGEFLKGVASGVTMGIYDHVRSEEKEVFGPEFSEIAEEEYGTARKIGNVAGWGAGILSTFFTGGATGAAAGAARAGVGAARAGVLAKRSGASLLANASNAPKIASLATPVAKLATKEFNKNTAKQMATLGIIAKQNPQAVQSALHIARTGGGKITKDVAKKVFKNLPLKHATGAILKAGEIGSKTLQSYGAKVGLTGKVTQQALGYTGWVSGVTAAEASIFGAINTVDDLSRRPKDFSDQVGRYEASDHFNFSRAASLGAKNFVENAKYSVAFTVGVPVSLKVAGRAVGLFGKGVKVATDVPGLKQLKGLAGQGLKKIKPTTVKALEWSSEGLSKSALGVPGSPKEFIQFKRSVGRSFKNILDDHPDFIDMKDIRGIYDNIPLESKSLLKGIKDLNNPTIKELQNNMIEIFDKGKNIDFFDLIYKKYPDVFGNELPKNNSDFFKQMRIFREKVGSQIGEVNNGIENTLRSSYKEGLKSKNELLNIKDKDIVKFADDLSENTLNLNKRTVREIESDLFIKDYSIDPSIRKGVKLNKVMKDKISPLGKGGAFKNQVEIKKSFNQWARLNGYDIGMKELAGNKKVLAKHYQDFLEKNLNIKDKKVLNQLKEMSEQHFENNPELIDFLVENQMFKTLATQKNLSLNQMKSLDKIFVKHSNTRNLPKAFDDYHVKVKKMISDHMEVNMPNHFSVPYKNIEKIIKGSEENILEFKKIIGQKNNPVIEEALNITKDAKYFGKVSYPALNRLLVRLDDLANYSKTQKGSGLKLTEVEKKARQLREPINEQINKMTKNISKNQKNLSPELKKNINNLKTIKSKYAIGKQLEGFLDSKIAGSVAGSSLKDVGLVVSGAFSSNFFWKIGAAMFGPVGGVLAGTAGGVGSLVGIRYASVQHPHFITGARKLSSWSKSMSNNSNSYYRNFIDKTKSMYSSVKSKPQLLINNPVKLYFFMKPNDVSSVNLNKMSEDEIFNNLSEESSGSDIYLNQDMEQVMAIQAYAGSQASQEFGEQMMDLKKMVMDDMPKGTLNPITGKRSYTKIEKKAFYNKIDKYLNLDNFIYAIKKGTISLDSINKVRAIYPEAYRNIVLRVLEEVENKKIKMTPELQRSLMILRGESNTQFFQKIDAIGKEKEMEQSKKQRKGGVKFSSLMQPSSEQRIRGV